MSRIFTGVLLAALAATSLAQQRQPVFADPTGRTASPPPASQAPARFADPNPERLTADQQRCRNLDQEIARADEQARQATTTGAQNQFAAKRQRLMEQRGRAGC
jgi:hypothetical protein